MAWPVTARLVNGVANTTRIAWSFLNAVQDAIVGVYGGGKTIKKISVDGIGDQASAAADGDIAATGDIYTTAGDVNAAHDVIGGNRVASLTARSSATPGSGQSVALGHIWKDTACFAWAYVTVNAAGPSITLVRGVNIASVVRNGIGDYTVTLQTAAPNKLIPIASPLDDAFSTMIIIDRASLTTSAIKLLMRDPAGQVDPNNANGGFLLLVFAG